MAGGPGPAPALRPLPGRHRLHGQLRPTPAPTPVPARLPFAGAPDPAAAAAQLAFGGFVLFLTWVVLKALLIAIPLCTAMRIALANQEREMALQQVQQAYSLELGEGGRLVVRGPLLRPQQQGGSGGGGSELV